MKHLALISLLLATDTGIAYNPKLVPQTCVIIQGREDECFESCAGYKLGAFRKVKKDCDSSVECVQGFELCIQFDERPEFRFWMPFPRQCKNTAVSMR